MADDAGAATRRAGESGVGFTLLDGIALVAGAAIASVHLRQAATPAKVSHNRALLGMPWVLSALPRIASHAGREGGDVAGQLSEFALIVGLGVSTIATVAVVWSRWVMVPPGAEPGAEEGGWTHRIGLTLAVAWPLQCGLGMVVLGSPS